ncbi:MAG: CoA-binding protein [Candidatus Hydrogenedentota bacterium]|nr:MAG: CoA-binding protein [Candidatus Hydrogenedentota bacterium]
MNTESTSQAGGADLDALFQPQSVAHVGASPRPVAGRFNYTRYLIHMRFEGKIYPVNPKYEEVLELPCYPNLAAIPGEVDMAILAVPAAHCLEVLQNVPPGKVKFVVIHTSGFGEIDKRDLEAEILQLAREKGFRVVGPNCMGVYSQQGRVGFWREHWEIVDRPGSVGFISQSGGHAVNIIFSGMDAGINFNKVLSLGNQLDVSINEVLEYMGNDESIGVIGIYVEEVREGRRFLQLLKDVGKRKPVVVWKGGVTPVGKEAAATHTGSMAGNQQIFAAAMRQAGVISVDDFSQLLRLIRLLQPEFELPGKRLAIFSPGGGNSVSICDLFSAQPNLSLPPLTMETQKKLRAILPEENVDVRNPIDPGAVGSLQLDQLIKVVGADPQIESIVVLISADYLSNIRSEESRVLAVEMISAMLSRYSERIGKPIHVLLQQHRQNHEDYDRYRRLMVEKFNEKHIPWIDGSFKDVAKAFSQLVQYKTYLESVSE